MKKIGPLLSFLGLLLLSSVPCYPQSRDVLGWQDARWGMREADIVKAFGSSLKRLPQREIFVRRHADYVIPEFELGGNIFTVFFQMDDATNKLSQVLVRSNEMESRIPREQLFNNLESLLTREYGSPSDQTNERWSEPLINYKSMYLSRTWKFPTTTVELYYGWDNQIYASLLTIRYFPGSPSDVGRRLTTASSRPPDSVLLINLPRVQVGCFSRAAAEAERRADRT